MKHFILTAAAAAALIALGSCSKIETVGVSDANYIGFEGAFVGNPTKAVEEVNDVNINHFIVYGGYESASNLFEDVRVEPNANFVWTYSPLVPWENNQTYKFAAYSPSTLTIKPSFEYADGGLTFENITVDNTNNQVDFVYDESGEIISGDEGSQRSKVAFAFDHMFSMIKFTIKSGFPEDVKLTISEIKFYGMNSVNTLVNGQWQSPATPIVEEKAIILAGTAVGKEVQATETPVDYVNNCVVLPQTVPVNQVYAKFTVTAPVSESIKTEVSKDITAVIPADIWEKGFKYNYIVTIDGQTLDFITFDTPVVNEWTIEEIDMKNDENNAGQIIGA